MNHPLDDVGRIPMQQTHGCIVASLQVELTDRVLQQFQTELLHRIRAVQPSGVIFDVSGQELFDSHEFLALRRTMAMVQLMGCPTAVMGIQPGMAAAIAETDINCDEMTTARTLEEAIGLLGASRDRPTPS